MTFDRLKRLAKKHDMLLYKHTRGEDSYILVDIRYNAVAAPVPMTLAEVELWLDDLDNSDADHDD